MNTLASFNQKLDALHLLKHDFHQAWNKGELGIETLRFYAKEYYSHVAAFPRYISGIHMLCPNIEDRQVLLGHLIEEEQGEENHPELWLRFAEGLGVSRKQCKKEPQCLQTKELVEKYFDLVKESYPKGLGALYAYERQTPEVSKSKIEGLKEHYGISSDRTLKFFSVHMEADEWHTEEVAGLIEKLDDDSKKLAAEGAMEGANLLWKFLDGMLEKHQKEKGRKQH